jgi:hypothetical protein
MRRFHEPRVPFVSSLAGSAGRVRTFANQQKA